MKKVKIGMIGTGDMGQVHLRALAALDNSAQIIALYDPSEERLKVAENLLPYQVVTCNSLHDLLKNKDIEAVFVCSPNDIHYEQAIAAMEHGKHLFLEKPLATNMDQVCEIVAMAKKKNLILQVGLVYRYSAMFRRIAELVTNEVIGQPRMVWCHEFRVPYPVGRDREWRYSQSRTAGTLVEKTCHHFDLFNWILSDEPIRVFASGGCDVIRTGGPIEPGVPGEPYKYEGRCDVLDNAWVVIEYAGGARANLGLCMFADNRELPFGVLGTKGWIEAFVNAQKLKYCVYSNGKIFEETFSDRIVGRNQYMGHPGGQAQVVEFLDCVRERKDSFCNGDVALRSMAVSFAAEESVKIGCYVSVDIDSHLRRVGTLHR